MKQELGKIIYFSTEVSFAAMINKLNEMIRHMLSFQFSFLLFLGILRYDNEFETNLIQLFLQLKLTYASTEIKLFRKQKKKSCFALSAATLFRERWKQYDVVYIF